MYYQTVDILRNSLRGIEKTERVRKRKWESVRTPRGALALVEDPVEGRWLSSHSNLYRVDLTFYSASSTLLHSALFFIPLHTFALTFSSLLWFLSNRSFRRAHSHARTHYIEKHARAHVRRSNAFEMVSILFLLLYFFGVIRPHPFHPCQTSPKPTPPFFAWWFGHPLLFLQHPQDLYKLCEYTQRKDLLDSNKSE